MSSDKYIHENVENKIYSYWEEKNLFKPKSNKKQFSIVIPPPNVTGSLHMGHALNNSIQVMLDSILIISNFLQKKINFSIAVTLINRLNELYKI